VNLNSEGDNTVKILICVSFCLAVSALLSSSAFLSAQELKPIKLPKPQTDIGKPLMQVLNARQTAREFSERTLPLQELSNLLWAAWGINRPDSGKRTAPSASNRQEMDVYAVTADGAYLYDAKENALIPSVEGDIRAQTGRQPFPATAPLNLVYVADYTKMANVPEKNRVFLSAADTGFISQNVYLYCASQGLATVVRAMVDKPALEKAMKLRPDQKVILAQTVGYPK
jgi:SagB-type dehydrogenase family enzyme